MSRADLVAQAILVGCPVAIAGLAAATGAASATVLCVLSRLNIIARAVPCAFVLYVAVAAVGGRFIVTAVTTGAAGTDTIGDAGSPIIPLSVAVACPLLSSLLPIAETGLLLFLTGNANGAARVPASPVAVVIAGFCLRTNTITTLLKLLIGSANSLVLAGTPPAAKAAGFGAAIAAGLLLIGSANSLVLAGTPPAAKAAGFGAAIAAALLLIGSANSLVLAGTPLIVSTTGHGAAVAAGLLLAGTTVPAVLTRPPLSPLTFLSADLGLRAPVTTGLLFFITGLTLGILAAGIAILPGVPTIETDVFEFTITVVVEPVSADFLCRRIDSGITVITVAGAAAI